MPSKTPFRAFACVSDRDEIRATAIVTKRGRMRENSMLRDHYRTSELPSFESGDGSRSCAAVQV